MLLELETPVAERNSSVKYYVRKEDIFGGINDAHLAIGHGRRNRMVKETQTKYKDITTENIMLCLKRFGNRANDI